MQLTVLGQTSEQLVNVALNLPVDVALGQNLPLVDALYNPDMKPALAMLTCLRSQPRRRYKTSKSYQEADEELEELSSNSDEGDSDEGEVGSPPHTLQLRQVRRLQLTVERRMTQPMMLRPVAGRQGNQW